MDNLTSTCDPRSALWVLGSYSKQRLKKVKPNLPIPEIPLVLRKFRQ